MRDHRGALEYDLMTRAGMTMREAGGRVRVSSLSSFCRHLPPDSATMRELFPEEAERVAWARGEATGQLVVMLINEVRSLHHTLGDLLTRSRTIPPNPVLTPWDEAPEGEKHLGSGAVPVGDFDDWWDAQGRQD